MKEPEKIRLTPEAPTAQSVELRKLEPNVQHLYDEHGYVTSIEINYENTKKSTETELREI